MCRRCAAGPGKPGKLELTHVVPCAGLNRRSDPYIVFSIDPPSNPGCKIFRRGGYFGRKTKTDVQLCNLNPFWEEAFVPLCYLGTRSELENEILRVRVFDFDLMSSDDLIGKVTYLPTYGLNCYLLTCYSLTDSTATYLLLTRY